MMQTRMILIWITIFVFWVGQVDAQTIDDPRVRAFLASESDNAMVVRTEVDARYRPTGKSFKVPYLDIPESEMIWVDSYIESRENREQVLRPCGSSRCIRFYIHPESINLYQPLINQFGVDGKPTGFAVGVPTSSTRTLLLWDSDRPDYPLFVKTSLAKRQDKMGRIVTDWEIRRSVGITALASLTSVEEWNQNHTSIVSEFSGAYVPKKFNLDFYIDETQGNVATHGLIYRDASFLTQFPDLEVIPFFALLTERSTGAPRIVEWFRQSGEKDFYQYLLRTVIRPMMQSFGYLFFDQGIIPETHSQNLVVAMDPKTKTVQHVFHRDVGSMKVDLKQRMIRARSVHVLRSKNAAFDFKFDRSEQRIEDAIVDYYFGMSFSMPRDYGYGASIQKYLPEYSSIKVKALIQKEMQIQLAHWLPLKGVTKKLRTSEHVSLWYSQNIPKISGKAIPYTSSMKEWIHSKRRLQQSMLLPSEWFKQNPPISDGELWSTAYGVIEKEGRQWRLYYLDCDDLLH